MTLADSTRPNVVYSAKTEDIDFYGTLTKENNGKSEALGRIRFHDGNIWTFRHSAQERHVIKNKLLVLCETIAAIYRTPVYVIKADTHAGSKRSKVWTPVGQSILN